MILVDANLLLYARLSAFPQHSAAHRWLDDALSRPGRVGLPWASLVAFVRLATNPRVLSQPLTVDVAWGGVREWLHAPTAWIPVPTDAHESTLDRLIRGQGLTSKLVMDADLAALAIEHGLSLCSADGDFARFPEARWTNPLVPSP